MQQTLCDRCGAVVLEKRGAYQLSGGKFERGADLCHPCYAAFERFMENGKPALPLETPAAPGIPGTCPHGFTGHICCICSKMVCNLCGLYSAHGAYYCSTHKPAMAAHAR